VEPGPQQQPELVEGPRGRRRLAEKLVPLGRRRPREGRRDQFVGGREVVGDQAGEHAEDAGHALGGHLVEALADGEGGGGLGDLRQPLASRFPAHRRLGS
jgi:hypothetical protein